MRFTSIMVGVWCAVSLTRCLSARHRALPPADDKFLIAVSNAVYMGDACTDGSPRESIRMTNGSYTTISDPSSEATRVNYSIKKVVLGDLNHDGVNDAAVVVLVEPLGGTGRWYDLYAVINSHARAVPTVPIFLGDRVEIISAEILSGGIVVEFYDHYPDEGLGVTPTHKTFRAYRYDSGGLHE